MKITTTRNNPFRATLPHRLTEVLTKQTRLPNALTDRPPTVPANYGVEFFGRRRGWKSVLHRALSDRLFLSLGHLRWIGHWPNLRRPRTFNERNLHRALVQRPDLRHYIDKVESRDFVAEEHGLEFVPKRFLVGASHAIPWHELPTRFVISATHGSGMTMIINDMDSLDKPMAESVMRDWLGIDYARLTSQPIYAGIRPRLIVEQNLSEPDGRPPIDYKFFCFHGSPRYVHVDLDRHTELQRVVYDMQWRPAPFGKTLANARVNVPRPAQFDLMSELAGKLSQGFDFVRIDLFAVGNDGVVFGEFTFLPASGCGKFVPHAYDRLLGDLMARPGRLPAD